MVIFMFQLSINILWNKSCLWAKTKIIILASVISGERHAEQSSPKSSGSELETARTRARNIDVQALRLLATERALQYPEPGLEAPALWLAPHQPRKQVDKRH
jgi:hypothetical protein